MTSYGDWWWWLVLGALLGWLASWWLARRRLVTVERIVETIVERPADRMVDRIVDKPIDNPLHANRIRELEAEVEQIPALQAAITRLKADAARLALLPMPPAAAHPAPPISSNIAASVSVKPLDPPPQPVPQKLANRIMDRALDRLLDRQADLAANNPSDALRKLQDELSPGVDKKRQGDL